jgi:uncharacterized damage-inducible protein DinB
VYFLKSNDALRAYDEPGSITVATQYPGAHAYSPLAASKVFAVNERMNQLLIERLAPEAWAAKPPGNVRTIAALFTHMHNVRCKWIRLSAPHLHVPAQLNRAHCSPAQASAGLAESALRCTEMLDQAIGTRAGRVEVFRRDGWAPAWPVGIEMLCYMLSHEAHHRGQACILAHQLGFPLATEMVYGLWNWDKLWKECGFPHGPGH